jgi:hypothetical protein
MVTMKYDAVFGIGTLIVLMTMLIAPSVKGHDDGLVALILTDDTSYEAGDTIKVTVHVMHDAEYVDPDQSPVLIFSGPPGMRSLKEFNEDVGGREYTTQKDSKGIYKADIPVFDSDAESGDYAYIYLKPLFTTDPDSYLSEQVAITYGMSGGSDTTYDYIVANRWDGASVMIAEKMDAETGLTLEYELMDISDCPWAPGDTVEFNVRVEKDGSAVKPDQFEVTDRNDDPVPYNNPSTGVYEITFTIPSSLKENSDQDLTVKAGIVGAKNETATIEMPIPVTLFHIWLHEIPAPNSTTSAFEIYVSDSDGKAVQDAKVGIEVGYSSSKTYTATTDASGGADFLIEKNEDSSYMQGYIATGSSNQTFSAHLTAEVSDVDGWEPDPSGYGFDVEERPNSGSEPMVMYAFMDGEAMVGSTIYYYLYTDSKLLSMGEIVTGSEGKFTVPGAVPEESAEIMFTTSDGYHPGVFISKWNDTDGDGYSDKFEEHIGSDPSNKSSVPIGYKDTDGDRFGDAYEIDEGTDWNDSGEYPTDLKDSDGDGFTDKFEDFSGSIKTDAGSIPVGYIDADGDHFGDTYELTQGKDPDDPQSYPSTYNDTDSDGWGDEFETSNGTLPDDPYSWPDFYYDSDGDVHDDDEEAFYGTSPSDIGDYPHDDFIVNSDEDSLPIDWFSSDPQYDLEEIFYGTDPENASEYPKPMSLDSDYDGYCDNEEEFWGSSPWTSMEVPTDNYTINTDEDSLDYFDQQYDLEEMFYGTDPYNATDLPIGYDIDSDYDDVCDAEEIFYGTSPHSYSDTPDDRPDPWDDRYSDHNSTDGLRYTSDGTSIGYGTIADLFDDLDNEGIGIEIDDFRVGGRNVVRMSGEGSSVMVAVIIMGDDSQLKDIISGRSGSAWQMLEPEMGIPIYRTSDGWVGAFVMPEFLPKGDQKYTIVGGTGGEDLDFRFNHVTMKDGESMSTKDKDEGISTTMLVTGACCVVLIVVFILVAIVLVMMFSRKGKVKSTGTAAKEE